MRRIAVIGSGYVGLVLGACLADLGMNIICVDNNEEKIQKLKSGKIPVYEPGLEAIVAKNAACGRLVFTTDTRGAVEECEIIFIAVGTPAREDGSADIQYVLQAAEEIGLSLNGYKVIVDKSTVPVGTGQKVKKAIRDILEERGVNYSFDVVSNPEFLREGSAVYDFFHPDRIILGVESGKAGKWMLEVYEKFIEKGVPILFTGIETSELIKYAANAFLAMKITFINEIAYLCRKIGADVHDVAKGIGLDKRIGADFLKAGPGYGGSCFPKDTRALVRIGRDYQAPLTLVEGTIRANETHKHRMVEIMEEAMVNLEGKTLAVLGITFKADTDDMREAPSLVILQELAAKGVSLRIFDPQGETEGKWRLASIRDSITFCRDEYEAVAGVDGLVILTDWKRFLSLDLDRVFQSMRDYHFFDFRNMFARETLSQKGFKYVGVGR